MTESKRTNKRHLAQTNFHLLFRKLIDQRRKKTTNIQNCSRYFLDDIMGSHEIQWQNLTYNIDLSRLKRKYFRPASVGICISCAKARGLHCGSDHPRIGPYILGHSLVHSLVPLTHSLTPEKVNGLMSQHDLVMSHSGWVVKPTHNWLSATA